MTIPFRTGAGSANPGMRATVVFADSPYTIKPTEREIPVSVAGGAVTVKLPLANTVRRGDKVRVFDVAGLTNTLTILCQGSDHVFDGSTTSGELNESRGAIEFESDGTSQWYVVGGLAYFT